MSDLNTGMVEKYRNNFLKEVEANVEEGDWVKMCMQCGVCSGSCRIRGLSCLLHHKTRSSQPEQISPCSPLQM